MSRLLCSLCLAASPVLWVPVRRCLRCLVGHRPVTVLVDLPGRTVGALYDTGGSLVAHDGERVVELGPDERAAVQRELVRAEIIEQRAAS